ncbi:MAG: hypothetical protein AAGA83_10170 [Cyanobacteria bacterium P01_F01_bin.116]
MRIDFQTKKANPDKLQKVVQKILSNSQYRKKAQESKAKMQQCQSHEKAVTLIEEFLDERIY